MTAALLLGLLIGIPLGLLGGGGSILAVPALVYGVGMPLAEAVPTSLVVVGASSVTAVLPRLRAGQVQWRVAAVFGLAGAGTAFVGAAVNRLLDPSIVLLGFAALMVAAAVGMLRGQSETGGACALPDGAINWRSCLPKSLGSGAAVGFLTGLFGLGGGFLIVPALVLLLGLPMTIAVGTSLVVIVLNSSAGFAAFLGNVQLDYPLTATFAGSAIVGSLIAGQMAQHLPAAQLRHWFAYLVLLVAALIFLQLAINPSAIPAS
ncbi:MAG: sulfite exporter TauE/SafE family protein [Nocardioidaceae bacterium]